MKKDLRFNQFFKHSIGRPDITADIDWPPAVIAGAYQTGVLGMRSLIRRGVRSYCFDCNLQNSGFQSVYGKAYLCPDPDSQSEAWLDFMLDLAREIKNKSVLIPSSDKFVTAIAKHARILDSYYTFSPGIALQGLLADKQTQYELAAANGMPMPHTAFAKTLEQVFTFSNEVSFPCLVKPNHFREWRKFSPQHPLFDLKIAIADTPQDLISIYKLASEVNPNVILQEIIQGEDIAKRVYLSCYDSRSRRIANAMFRELRCDPIGFGPASISEPVIDDASDDVCDRFLKNIGYQGLCEIEMKWDARDGRVKLIEANPRLSGGGDAAPYAGVDLCWIHYSDLIGKTFPPIKPDGKHFKHIVLRADAKAAPAYLRAGKISWHDILYSYSPPLAFFDLDKRDLRYSLETVVIYALSVLRGIFDQ